MADKKELAMMIIEMNYGALRDVAAELAAACEDKEARPQLKTGQDFADLLFDWAEANADA